MGRARVRDVMTSDVVSVHPDTGYREIADLLAQRQISAMPVVDRAGHVLGVVSEADLLAKVEFTAPFPAASALVSRRRRSDWAKSAGDVASDLMSRPAVTVERDVSLATAARMMADEQVKRLPVVDSHGGLVGVVSRRDLLRGYLRSDEQLREAVIGEVLWEWFRIRPPQVQVSVREGVVTLAGMLDQRQQAALAVHLVRGVDGVVDVDDQLTWRADETATATAATSQPPPRR
ncbi:MAG TPA: CBS domain-containing protein [Micromonosporaceae bacterium]